jgi:hypothetical protein
MKGVTYDTGALLAAERNDPEDIQRIVASIGEDVPIEAV